MNQDEEISLPLDAMMSAVGFPTFDEFKKNPDHWREKFLGHKEEIFQSVESSTQTDFVRKQLTEQRYYWRDQYDCGKSLEKIQRIAREEGYEPWDLEMEPVIRPVHGTSGRGPVEIIVRFWPKVEWAAKGKIITNA